MAEGFARALGQGRVQAFSAGSEPKGVHPLAVKTMAEFGIDISKQMSKHVDNFAAQHFDYVITVCDRAKEVCPVWPGVKEQLHWSIEDPAAFVGSTGEVDRTFYRVAAELKRRIELFLAATRV
jgi:arsenate reductase